LGRLRKRECWYCHKDTMVDQGGYRRCNNCGATDSPVAKPGRPTMVYTPGAMRTLSDQTRLPHFSPSGTEKRRAAKARGDK
jgi:hypothetical protein